MHYLKCLFLHCVPPHEIRCVRLCQIERAGSDDTAPPVAIAFALLDCRLSGYHPDEHGLGHGRDQHLIFAFRAMEYLRFHILPRRARALHKLPATNVLFQDMTGGLWRRAAHLRY